jgi:hypothetical protein
MERIAATDNRVEFLLLLCDDFQYNFVWLWLLDYCSRALKQVATRRSVLRTRMMYPRHDGRISRVSWNQG